MHQQLAQLAEQCYQAGVTHAVICPGSRSAPLVFAFNRHPHIKTFVIVDERSAGYIALGMAQQLQKPVALICTSGTAALNFYPAIAEAFYQKIPLLVLTADRPAALLNQQDGQMINQQGVYGSHVRAQMQFLVDSWQLATESNRHLSEILNRCLYPVWGPVHVNVPLKEPLYQISQEDSVIEQNHTVEAKPLLTKSPYYLGHLNQEKIMVLIGQCLPNAAITKQIKSLANRSNVVVLADVVSNQHDSTSIKHFDYIVSQTDSDCLKELEPQVLISMGGPVLSKALKLWLKKQKPIKHIRLQDDSILVDTYGNVTDYVSTNQLASIIENIIESQSIQTESYQQVWSKFEKKAQEAIQKFIVNRNQHGLKSELLSVNTILSALPSSSQLQIANSSSIRYVSYLGLPEKKLSAFCNRGTSGIDGCTSTAIGAALMSNEIVTLITGDLAFFYDRNAFWNKYVPNHLRIVLLNNHGGGIFNLIDGPNSQPELENFFLTTHHQTAKNMSEDFGLDYYFCKNQIELEELMKTFYEPSDRPKIVEISSDIAENSRVFREFKSAKL
jgi:2-succinyl-5-enolpyruvyl-6-hydroxy-3-cyclohexene-1-carboxylate synthase